MGGGDAFQTPPRGTNGASNGKEAKPNGKPKLAVDTSMTVPTTNTKINSTANGTHKAATTAAEAPPPTTPLRRGSISSRIEEKIGYCVEEFRCQHNNFTGILYVGPLGIVFLGRFLLFEWTVVLKWEEVAKVKRRVTTPTTFGIRQDVGIRIELAKPEETKTGTPHSNANAKASLYDFEGFFDSQKALETLIGLHNDSMLDNPDKLSQIITKRGSVIPLRRSNSNPAEQISNIFSFEDESPLVFPQNSNLNHQQNQTAIEDLRNQYSATHKAALQKSPNIFRANSSASQSSSVDAPQALVIPRDNIATATATLTSPPRRGGGNTMTPDPLESAWKKVCSDLQEYPEVPVCDKELSLEGDDLDAFVDTFVRDDAPFSWSKFMTDVTGETDVQATQWASASCDASAETGAQAPTTTPVVKALTRTIDYTHPVNAPMAPPTARARKEQTLKRFGNHLGLVVETKTVVSDVPMTDCFYVRDVLQVAKSPCQTKWVLNIRFEVVFVKSTMFRALISKTTTSEFRAFMNDLANYLCTNCTTSHSNGVVDPPTNELSPPKTEALPSAQAALAETKHSKGTASNPSRSEFGWKVLIAIVLVWMAQLQARMWRESQDLRKELHELISAQSALEANRATELRLLRDELREWKDAVSALEQDRASERIALVNELREWRVSLAEQSKAAAAAAATPECAATKRSDQRIPSPLEQKPSIPRQGGIHGGPLLVEPVLQHRLRGGYRRSSQTAATTTSSQFEEMNNWETLEQCQECYN